MDVVPCRRFRIFLGRRGAEWTTRPELTFSVHVPPTPLISFRLPLRRAHAHEPKRVSRVRIAYEQKIKTAAQS